MLVKAAKSDTVTLNTVQKILLVKHEDVTMRLTFDLCKIRAAVEMDGFSYLTATSATV